MVFFIYYLITVFTIFCLAKLVKKTKQNKTSKDDGDSGTRTESRMLLKHHLNKKGMPTLQHNPITTVCMHVCVCM